MDRKILAVFTMLMFFSIVRSTTVVLETADIIENQYYATDTGYAAAEGITKWNLSAAGIDSGATINSALHCQYQYVTGAVSTDVQVCRGNNQTWEPSMGCAGYNTMRANRDNCENVTVSSQSDSVWACYDITTPMQADVTAGNNNLTVLVEQPEVASWTTCNVWQICDALEMSTAYVGTLSGSIYYGFVTYSGPAGQTPNVTIDYTLVSNTNPNVTAIDLSPDTVYTNNTVDCSFKCVDHDSGEVLKTNITWYINSGSGYAAHTSDDETQIATTNDTWTNTTATGDLESDEFNSTFGLICQATCYDDEGLFNATNSTALTVSNLNPVVTESEINPTSLTTNDILDCGMRGYDIDPQDTLKFNVTWYKDNAAHTSDDETQIAGANNTWTNTTATGDIESADTSEGETWICNVTIYDDQVGSSSKNSTGRTIGNSAPTITSVADSPDPVKGGATVTITPTGQADADAEDLYFYCDSASNPTSGTTDCTEANTAYSSPYSTMTCTFAAVADDSAHTVYCRVYDGTAYSSDVTTSYTSDSTSPTITVVRPQNNTDITYLATDYDDLNITFGETVNFGAYNVNLTGNTSTGAVAELNTTWDWGGGDWNITIYANDSVGNENHTFINFTVLKATPTVTITADGSSTASQTRTYPNQTNLAGTETNSVDSDCTYLYKQNDTTISSGSQNIAGSQAYNFTYGIFTACTNFTVGIDEIILTMNQNTTNPITPYLNDTQGNITCTYPCTVNSTVTSTYGALAGTLKIHRNGTEIHSGTSSIENVTLWAAAVYEFKFNLTGTANYTSNSTGLTYKATISKRPTSCTAYLNGTTADKVYPSSIANLTGVVNETTTVYLDLNATGYGDAFTSGTSSVENLTDTSLVTDGPYNFTVHAGNENYTSCSDSSILTIDKVYPQISFNEWEIGDLILLLHFNYETNDTSAISSTALDFTKFENNATFYNGSTNVCGGNSTDNTTCPQWTSSGKWGQAIVFDGSNDYAQCTNTSAFVSYCYAEKPSTTTGWTTKCYNGSHYHENGSYVASSLMYLKFASNNIKIGVNQTDNYFNGTIDLFQGYSRTLSPAEVESISIHGSVYKTVSKYIGTPPNATKWSGRSVYINVSFSDSRLNGSWISINATNYSLTNNGVIIINFTTPGTKTYYAHANDSANNVNTTATRTIFVLEIEPLRR